MRGIELRQLRYFSILASELHFRKAADLAFITQPALSQQISKLEETVGTALFTRDGRKVALRLTREAAGEREFRISIGLVEYTNLPFLPPALMRLQALYPALKVQRHEMHSVPQMEALERKVIDVGIGVQVGLLPGDASNRAQPEKTAPWEVLMRTDHRLASLDELCLDDLAGERLIFFERAVIPQLYDGLLAACRKAGFTPNFVYETQQSQVGMAMVSEGVGAMLGAAYIFHAPPAGLTTRPLRDMERLVVQLFWRSGEADPLIHEFMEVTQEEARRLQIRFQA